MYSNAHDAYLEVKNFISKNTNLSVPGGFPFIYLYWNKLNDDGTTTKIALGSGDESKSWGGTWASGAKFI